MKNVRVYGITIGNGSFARVTAGMVEGLEANGCFAGLVPVDALDDDVGYAGYDSDIAVLVGPPSVIPLMKQLGAHKERLYLFPPNSTYVPESIVRSVWPYVTGFVCPSKWACDILRGEIRRIMGVEKPVELWRHGVSKSIYRRHVDEDRSQVRISFDALHMSSTSSTRKGTQLLIEAWRKFAAATEAKNTNLNMVLDFPQYQVRGLAINSNSIIFTHSRNNASCEQISEEYSSYDIVVQPSRGEAFGMVPLEAACCGVPVVITGCAGHSEYIHDLEGCVTIPTGDLEEIDDGPGAMAQSLSANDITVALIKAYESYQLLSMYAQEYAPYVQNRWSWENVTKHWIDNRKVN